MRESEKELRSRARKINTRLKRAYPHAKIALDFTSPLELLVATVLSAQCTDVRVNQVTKDLFRKYRTARDYAIAPQAEFEQEIKPTGFFRNKAKSIIACCRELAEKHGGVVPETMEELTALPGIGRKTANVILGNAFGIPGIVVDTHVIRVSGRLGLTRNTDPEKIEPDLMPLVPKKDWVYFSHALILHGREVCEARKPKCRQCPLYELCLFEGKTR